MLKKILLLLLILIVPVQSIKAEVIIEIKIPDEIKCCKCNCGCCKKEPEKQIPQNPRITTGDNDSTVLQRIAVAEAENTDAYTMAYIMQTVLNRVNSPEFPNTVESVVKQKGQFSTYPDKYNKSSPNELSKQAYDLLPELENKEQLYFENTVPGSWQSSNLQLVFKYNSLSFYK